MKKDRFDSLDDSTYGSRNIIRIIIAVVIIALVGAMLLAESLHSQRPLDM